MCRFESEATDCNPFPQIQICSHRFESVATDCNLFPQIQICSNRFESVATDSKYFNFSRCQFKSSVVEGLIKRTPVYRKGAYFVVGGRAIFKGMYNRKHIKSVIQLQMVMILENIIYRKNTHMQGSTLAILDINEKISKMDSVLVVFFNLI